MSEHTPFWPTEPIYHVAARPMKLQQTEGLRQVDTSSMPGVRDDLDAEDELLIGLPMPCLLARLWRGLQILVVRYQIRSTAAYIAECEEDGILDSVSMRGFRAELEQLRCRLAMLEAGR